MENQDNKTSRGLKAIFIALLGIAGVLSAAGAIIMTDLGQIFGVSKELVVGYFLNNSTLILISFLALAGALIINYRNQILKRWIIGSICALWAIAVLSTKYVVPYAMFRTHQYNAEFAQIDDIRNGYIEDTDIVYAINHNGVQKAIPAKYIWQGHIVGANFGGDDVLFTYCIMTNLAVPYVDNFGNQPADFKVLAQTNNNLLIWDTNNNEIIQQITNTCEFSEKKLEPIPMLEMTWEGYKKLYPNGELFINEWDKPMEKALNLVFDREAVVYGGKWLFETVDLDDNRLPTKEHIIGFRDENSDHQLAFTKSFIQQQGVYNTTIGDKHITIKYFPEYETVAAFNREIDGEIIDIDDIDIFGNTPENAQLRQEFLYSGVYWEVWMHYYPNTEWLI